MGVGSFSNSFSTCIGQQIHLYTSWSESRQHKFLDIDSSTFPPKEYSTAALFWNTLWLKSRQHKFTDISNSIFLQERSSTATKFFEEFTPYSLFSLNCREQQSLNTSKSCENSQDYKNDVFSVLWLQPKRVILLAGGVSSKKSHHFLLTVTTIKVPSRNMFPLQ